MTLHKDTGRGVRDQQTGKAGGTWEELREKQGAITIGEGL